MSLEETDRVCYHVVCDARLEYFRSAVNVFLESGWQLYGPTQAVVVGEDVWWYQALVRPAPQGGLHYQIELVDEDTRP